jgi:hypothetical protein
MNHNTNKQPDKTAQNIPNLSDLVGFDIPKMTMTFPAPNELIYILDGAVDDLAKLKNAASNASELLTHI